MSLSAGGAGASATSNDAQSQRPYIAVVFGATGAIGGGAARDFLSNGWEVLCAVRNATHAKAQSLCAAGAELCEIDLSQPSSSVALLAWLGPERISRVRAVVSSMGAGWTEESLPLYTAAPGSLDAMFSTNVATHVNGWRACGGALQGIRATYIFVRAPLRQRGARNRILTPPSPLTPLS